MAGKEGGQKGEGEGHAEPSPLLQFAQDQLHLRVSEGPGDPITSKPYAPPEGVTDIPGLEVSGTVAALGDGAGVGAQPPATCVTPHDVASHGVSSNAL